jgi:signal peptidase II
MIKKIYALVFILAFVSDQITKLWAESRFLDAMGFGNGEIVPVIGDLFRFQLAYNLGSAFSMRPQAIVPWLHPTLFYSLITVLAIWGLYSYFKQIDPRDKGSKWGVILVLSGALGNLADRFRIGKVVDFISWDFPDIDFMGFVMHRWPVFNLADSWVMIGVGLLIFSPSIFIKDSKTSKSEVELKTKVEK